MASEQQVNNATATEQFDRCFYNPQEPEVFTITK